VKGDDYVNRAPFFFLFLLIVSTLAFGGCGPSQISEDEVPIDSTVVLDGDKDDKGGSATDE
jgi:hypothetical protein